MCQHTNVYRHNGPKGKTWWECKACGAEFVPTALLEEAELVAQAASMAASDILVRTLNAIYHKRDKEGIEPDEHQHTYGDDGRCTECGFTPFIGADRQPAEEDMAATGTGEADA